jgi:hypothetical protein
MVGCNMSNVLVKGPSAFSKGRAAWGVGVSPWWGVAISFAACLAVVAVVGLVAGQAIWRRLQALLPLDPAVGEHTSQLSRAAPARVVFRILQASERKRRERPAGVARAGCNLAKKVWVDCAELQ